MRQPLRETALGSIVFAGAMLAVAVVAEAQQQMKISRIGFLGGVFPSAVSDRIEALRQGLRELGYVEGKNIFIEYRYAEDNLDRLPLLASELVDLKVDVIVTGGPGSTGAAKQATGKIPIVMAQDTDPIGTGYIASLARPGGNITGLSTFAPEISGKQLELLKQIVPKLSRVAVLGTSTTPGTAQILAETEIVAGAMGIKLLSIDVKDAKDIETAFPVAGDRGADAVLVLANPVLNSQRTQVVALAVKSRRPATYPFPEFVEAGGLMSYGVSFTDLYRRAAIYIDKILKGAKPADLPVEQPTKFELVINLKTAKQIGLVIPPNVLARADRVIK